MIKTFARLFRKAPKHAITTAAPPEIIYHAEQDGDRERRLKAIWVQIFRTTPSIRKAFFVTATLLDAQQPSLVLALATSMQPSAGLLDEVQRRAREMLSEDTHLEILVVSPRECAPIERVCRAFYFSA